MQRALIALGCVTFAGLALAATSTAPMRDREAIARAFGFSEGVAPISDGAASASAHLRALDCGTCHEQEHAEWRASRHASAFSNAVFQEGLRREPALRCVHCHAPSRAQAREVAAAFPAGSFLQRRAQLRTRTLLVPASARAHEGVDCAACHVRDGVVLTTSAKGDVRRSEASPPDGHAPSPLASALSESAFCGSCHQFRFHELHQGRVVLTDLLIQSTFDEWQAYAAAGGEGTCQSCHMKGGSHEVLGTRHLEFLRGALAVSVERGEGGGPDVLELSPVGVGHHFPTGDVFRHLTVEVEERGGHWREVAWLGRKYEPRRNEATGRSSMALVSDTALRPNEVRRVELPHGGRAYRVRYHYVADDPDARAALLPEDVSVVLAERALPEPEKAP